MFEYHAPVRFYLGANTPVGFVGYLDDLYDAGDGWQAYIIKSGPGTGKSSLMRTVMNTMSELGQEPEAIYCSSDPRSLDGVLFPKLKICILDGTAPHVIEPRYWGAVEQIVNLSACMDGDLLHRQHAAIMSATDACSAMHVRCRKFIGAAASLLGDSARILQEFTDGEKVARTAARIAAREFGCHSGAPGKERRRFLSAVTPEGIVTFHETIQALCPRIYAVEDEHGAASRLLLGDLRRRALDARTGYRHLRLPAGAPRQAGASAHPLPGSGLHHLQHLAQGGFPRLPADPRRPLHRYRGAALQASDSLLQPPRRPGAAQRSHPDRR